MVTKHLFLYQGMVLKEKKLTLSLLTSLAFVYFLQLKIFATNFLKNTCDPQYAALGNNLNSFRRSGR